MEVFLRSLVAGMLCLSACAGSSTAEKRDACPTPTPQEDLGLLPSDVPLDEWGVVDQLGVNDGFLAGRAISETQIVELYPVIARATVEAGYEILAGDNEGFEAEIFFARGRDTTGNYILREGPCPEQVTIRLLYGAKRYREMT